MAALSIFSRAPGARHSEGSSGCREPLLKIGSKINPCHSADQIRVTGQGRTHKPVFKPNPFIRSLLHSPQEKSIDPVCHRDDSFLSRGGYDTMGRWHADILEKFF